MTKTITQLDPNPTLQRTDLFASDKLTAETVRNTIGSLEDYLVDRLLTEGGEQVGSFIMAPTADTTFYLECDGAEYNRSDYPELMAVWEPVYGSQTWFAGSDASKFRTPPHNTAGLFMRGLGSIYTTQGLVTNSTTKLPTDSFLVDIGHNHTASSITATANGIRILFAFDAQRTADNIIRGVKNLTRKNGASWRGANTGDNVQPSDRYTFDMTYTPSINAFTPQINAFSGSKTVTGGDAETAPASFTTKIWVLARPKLAFAPPPAGVSTVNGLNGDVTITSTSLGIQPVIDAQQNSINRINTGQLTSPASVVQPVNTLIHLRNTTVNTVVADNEIIQLIPIIDAGVVVADPWAQAPSYPITNDILFFKAVDGYVNYTADIRITGTFAGSTNAIRILRIQLQRVLDSVILQDVPLVRGSGDSIELTNTTLSTYTNGVNDGFITDGVKLIINNQSGADFTITNLELIIKGALIKWN